MIENPELLTGIVLHGAHGIYEVHTDSGIIRCTLRGKLKKAFARAQAATRSKGRPRASVNVYQLLREEREQSKRSKSEESGPTSPTRISVGDYVKLRRLDEQNGLIEEILPRQSELSRKDAGSTAEKIVPQTLLANLDQVVIVLAVAQPEPHFGFLDRYLAICEATRLQALICLNKADLPHASAIEEAAEQYRKLGYTLIFTSAHTGEGIEELRAHLKEHTTLFTGPSGVGKSSLVNALEPGMDIRTSEVSEATGKGRHTTTGSRLYPLSGGGWLADSAGIRALAAWNIPAEELAWCFVEFRPYLGECLYNDCTHINEEGCAILQAVEDGVVAESRHKSYVRMYMGEER
ncbi:ribosome small subunit-dependent GTPase A [Thermosporothrix hazakensis]|uniref:Small ribosomal subunit biogenesis GTPase RsgA n=1 Tax=Thermosporothrix sp. COM3 TaxID=2490863 RepID=A0A455SN36_9CHLR|nr:ribosome small subunit-dependent GTPase A [Thermosporothrix hazakensis]BBH89853.1 putative ribosome biogenesis GTPase RsgA [Thermosporothrix sp. COM3]GCE48049.1 putative ribosome biogenesis GTPase RsgA [Thermosporothrix hazakensis]